PELGPGGAVEVLHAGYPFVYVRGGRYLVVVNPQQHTASCPYEPAVHRALEVLGVEITDGTITARGFGHGVFDLRG
ncbi:oligo-1,6-glucosidase, partial [Streptomyces scabiei]|nr:oligo-1,6-glucosidase [Streptomyces scabiei]